MIYKREQYIIPKGLITFIKYIKNIFKKGLGRTHIASYVIDTTCCFINLMIDIYVRTSVSIQRYENARSLIAVNCEIYESP